ncbi:MAG: 50S ribosomal protein L4 [Gammaproteobacteria bacterium]|nr:50S ribosomal protein L4 [Gammaproteobacteria bacterium]
MELNLTPMGNNKAGVMQVDDASFACPYNESLVHQVVTSYLSAARAGTHAQKTRAQVRGGGKKPWKQKGSGRARAGTSRSPLWRGGGKVFAAVLGDYSGKVNKKMYRAALRSIFSELVRQERLVVVKEFPVDEVSTKALAAKLNGLGLNDVLVITDQLDDKLRLSARNLHHVEVREVSAVDPVSLVGFEKVLVTVPALQKLEEVLK